MSGTARLTLEGLLFLGNDRGTFWYNVMNTSPHHILPHFLMQKQTKIRNVIKSTSGLKNEGS